MVEEQQLADITRNYFEFFNDPHGTVEQLSNFLSTDVIWREMPNKFAPNGRTNDYAGMLKNFPIGQQFVWPQTYRIDDVVVQGNTVAVQLSWEGTMKQALGPFQAGEQLTCQVSSFLKFQDGKLVSQTDYPCYPPTAE